MLAESRAFLFDHGYAGPHIRAYTSRSRDAERAKWGLPPLESSETAREAMGAIDLDPASSAECQ